MEFEEFSRQFRLRTMQRMKEFEKALAQAQERVETAAAPSRETRTARKQMDPPPRRGRVRGVLRRE